MGIYIDSIQPKLIWDDELSALRENYNTFFSMAIAIAFAAVVCVGGFFLFCNTKLSIEMTGLILLLVLAVANILVLRLAVAAGPRNIEEQEEA
jgi:ABC-2 type transport system permease protein